MQLVHPYMRRMRTEMGRLKAGPASAHERDHMSATVTDHAHREAGNAKPRVDWVDYAKGFCIVFVVMMHSTLGVERAPGHGGFMHPVVAFAKPFRMPDFFLISGLFLAQVIDRDWRTYLDRKVVHFVYFYVFCFFIQLVYSAAYFC